MAAAASLSSIVAPSSSLSHLPSEYSTTAHFSPNYFPTPKPKPFLKTLPTLKPHNFTLSPLPLVFPLHLCHSSSEFNETQDSIFDGLEQNPDDVVVDFEQEQVEDEDELEQLQVQEEDEDEENNKEFVSVDDSRLFVGNLPYSMTSSQLSEIFTQAGQVRSIEIIYDKVTDRSRGFGFVTMGTTDEANEAIRMFDGSQVGGRTVRVNFPEVPKGGERKVMGPKIRKSYTSFVDTPHKIYAGNLNWVVTSQGLKEAFANQEGMLSAKVIYERDSGRSRGFGFVTFSSVEAADSALTAMNGVELEGRALRLNMASDRARPNTEVYAEQTA